MKSLNKTVFIFGFAGALLFILTTITAGFLFHDYSHTKQLISESYAVDTNYSFPLRYFGFLPSGLLIVLFAFGAKRILPKSLLSSVGLISIGVFYGLATIVVSIFPCDHGCNPELIDPSISQLIHNTSGLFTYLVVPVSLILIGIAAKKWNGGNFISLMSIVCGSITFLFVFLLSANMNSNFAGLLQRIIEGSILIWIMILSFYVKNLQQTPLK